MSHKLFEFFFFTYECVHLHELHVINKLLFGLRQGGCCSLCHLGASHLSLLSVLSRFLVLQTIAIRLHLGMCHFATTCLHEGHQAGEIGQEEEAKDASSTFYVKKHQTI